MSFATRKAMQAWKYMYYLVAEVAAWSHTARHVIFFCLSFMVYEFMCSSKSVCEIPASAASEDQNWDCGKQHLMFHSSNSLKWRFWKGYPFSDSSEEAHSSSNALLHLGDPCCSGRCLTMSSQWHSSVQSVCLCGQFLQLCIRYQSY